MTGEHRRSRRWRVTAVATALLFAVLAGSTACGAGRPADGRLKLVAGFYPLQFVAEQVGGERVRVENLSQPGAEPHDLELRPHQVADIADADLVVYLAGFQPAVDQAVAQSATASSFDVASTVPLLPGRDPHLWLDPTRLATIADALAKRLTEIDPQGADGYRDRATALGERLVGLDSEFEKGLATCQRREIITSHSAFGYLADRYRLVQIGISGLSPEVEPTPQRLAEVAAVARQKQATTIFFETLVSPRIAEAIAREVGASTAVLDPLEGPPQQVGADYFSVMRTNLAALRTALGCA